MPTAPDRSFYFLFRSDRGRIGRAVWWRGTIPLAVVAGLGTLGWVWLRRFTIHDLSKTALIDVPTLVAYVYLAVFSFAVILIAICEYNLSAKRFRDRGRTPALAAVLPLTFFLAGAIIWSVPNSFGELPPWTVSVASVAVAGVLIWNIVELGFGPSREPAA